MKRLTRCSSLDFPLWQPPSMIHASAILSILHYPPHPGSPIRSFFSFSLIFKRSHWTRRILHYSAIFSPKKITTNTTWKITIRASSCSKVSMIICCIRWIATRLVYLPLRLRHTTLFFHEHQRSLNHKKNCNLITLFVRWFSYWWTERDQSSHHMRSYLASLVQTFF